MKIEQMEYLVHFAQTGSITLTAAHFYMTKQGMNKALHQLERDSGYVLFESDSGGLKLTSAGEEFARQAAVIVEGFGELKRDMRIYAERGSELSGTPVIVLATSAAMRYLVPQLGLQKPGVFPFEVLLREMTQREIAETLAFRRSEKLLAILTLPAVEKYEREVSETMDAEGLVYDVLGEHEIFALVSSSSKLARQKNFDTRTDLPGQKVGYLYDEMLRDVLDDYVRDEDVRTVTSNIDLLDEQIATNRLITFAPTSRLLTKQPPHGIVALPCKNTMRIRYGLVRSHENEDDADILQVITHIRTTLSVSAVF